MILSFIAKLIGTLIQQTQLGMKVDTATVGSLQLVQLLQTIQIKILKS